MKKLVFAVSLFLVGFTVQAQDTYKNALGLRIGNNSGYRIGDSGDTGYEISYQRALKGITRLEFDVAFRENDDYKVVALHQWVSPLTAFPENFKFFVGAGAGYGATFGEGYGAIAGSAGLEYTFKFPIQLSIGTRPEYVFGNGGSGWDHDVSFGVRVKF